jgi:hypothetical protein
VVEGAQASVTFVKKLAGRIWAWFEACWWWIGRRVATVTPYGDLIALLFGALASIAALAHSGEYPHPHDWAKGRPLLLVQIIVTAGLLITQALNTLGRRRYRRRLDLEAACREVAAYVDEHCPNIPLRYVGVRIWKVGGPPFARYLRRRASFFLTGERAQSGVRWTQGKGVLGRAWEKRKAVIRDIVEIRDRVGREDDYHALPDEDQMGLTYEEFQQTPFYNVVYAAPLYSRAETSSAPRVRGVIAVDILQIDQFQELRDATEDAKFASVIGVCEAALKP